VKALNTPLHIEGNGSFETRDLSPHSLQQYQFIYNQLTSRAEKRTGFRFTAHKITTDHIVHLHKLIEQTVHTMTVVDSSVYLTQRSVDESSERWSGFEKFQHQSSTIPHITSDVEIVYNFLIQLPSTPEPSPYKITIGLRNALYEMESFRSQGGEIDTLELMMMSQMATARWEIEFVDASVARTITNTIEKWYDQIPVFEHSLTENLAKSFRPHINTFIRALSSIIVAYSIFGFSLFKMNSIETNKIAIFIFVLYFVHIVTTPLVSTFNKKLMCIKSTACLVITEKDRELLNKYEKNRGKILKFLWFQAFIPQVPAILLFVSDKLLKLF